MLWKPSAYGDRPLSGKEMGPANLEAIGAGAALHRRAQSAAEGWKLPKLGRQGPGPRRRRKLNKIKRRREELMPEDYERYPHLCPTATAIFNGVRFRALSRRLSITITPRWVLERLIRGRCEVTELPFDLHGGARNNFIPSIDQKEPGGGYTKENSQMVTWGYNAAKSTGSHEDVMRMARALVAAADHSFADPRS